MILGPLLSVMSAVQVSRFNAIVSSIDIPTIGQGDRKSLQENNNNGG